MNLGVEPYVVQRQLRSLRTTSRASNNKNSHDSRSHDLPVKSRDAETPTAGEDRDETKGEPSPREFRPLIETEERPRSFCDSGRGLAAQEVMNLERMSPPVSIDRVEVVQIFAGFLGQDVERRCGAVAGRDDGLDLVGPRRPTDDVGVADAGAAIAVGFNGARG